MSARSDIASKLWLGMPSTDNADAKAKTEQHLDDYRSEVLATRWSDFTVGGEGMWCSLCDRQILTEASGTLGDLTDAAFAHLYAEHRDRLASGEFRHATETGVRPVLPPGLALQIRAAANVTVGSGTYDHSARAVRDFARDLETWIPENAGPTAGEIR